MWQHGGAVVSTVSGVSLIGDSKLPVGVNVSVNGLRQTCDLPRLYPASYPLAAVVWWYIPELDKWKKTDVWMFNRHVWKLVRSDFK